MVKAKKIDGLIFRRMDDWYYLCRSRDRTYTLSGVPSHWLGGDPLESTWHCNCPAGTYGRECKHLRALKKLFEAEAVLEEELSCAWPEDRDWIEKKFWDANWDPAWDVPLDTSWREKTYQKFTREMEKKGWW